MRHRLKQANKFLEGALLMGLILKGTSLANKFLPGLDGPFLSFLALSAHAAVQQSLLSKAVKDIYFYISHFITFL